MRRGLEDDSCRTASVRNSWRHRVRTSAATAAMPTVPRSPRPEEVSQAALAMKRIQAIPAERTTTRNVVRALLGMDEPQPLSQADAKVVRGFVLTVNVCSSAALEVAIRMRLAPSHGRLDPIEACPKRAGDWVMCKELYLGRLLVERGVLPPSPALRKLLDPRRVGSRADWETLFGVRLPRRRRWRAWDDPSSDAVSLRQRARAAGGRVDGFSTRALLTLAQPSDTIGAGWGCPLAYLTQSTLHFAEIITAEGVDALARYLAARHAQLRSISPILEVGAGLGRLAYLLNRTNLMAHLPGGGVLASDPQPDDQCEAHGVRFELDVCDAATAVQRHRPDLVLCAWMEFGGDFTHQLRDGAVQVRASPIGTGTSTSTDTSPPTPPARARGII